MWNIQLTLTLKRLSASIFVYLTLKCQIEGCSAVKYSRSFSSYRFGPRPITNGDAEADRIKRKSDILDHSYSGQIRALRSGFAGHLTVPLPLSYPA